MQLHNISRSVNCIELEQAIFSSRRLCRCTNNWPDNIAQNLMYRLECKIAALHKQQNHRLSPELLSQLDIEKSMVSLANRTLSGRYPANGRHILTKRFMNDNKVGNIS